MTETKHNRAGRPPKPAGEKVQAQTIVIAPELRKWLDAHSRATGESMSRIVTRALEVEREKVGKE